MPTPEAFVSVFASDEAIHTAICSGKNSDNKAIPTFEPTPLIPISILKHSSSCDVANPNSSTASSRTDIYVSSVTSLPILGNALIVVIDVLHL